MMINNTIQITVQGRLFQWCAHVMVPFFMRARDQKIYHKMGTAQSMNMKIVAGPRGFFLPSLWSNKAWGTQAKFCLGLGSPWRIISVYRSRSRARVGYHRDKGLPCAHGPSRAASLTWSERADDKLDKTRGHHYQALLLKQQSRWERNVLERSRAAQ